MSSIAVHVVYIVGMVLVGYIKTKNYKPDIASAWDEVETLRKEVVFVKVNSPFLYLFSFLGVAVICGIIIFSYRNLLN
ncbi:menaquinol-cytochrome c reductase cytochrome b subunit [Paenisporosarcina sp. OV554]|nr:menaquinol-cytochrome c reductase cytochrome b subunit [Paenisporosarcina sp. OV554]